MQEDKVTQEQIRRLGPGVILGIVLVAAGGLFLLDNLGLLQLEFSVWKLWPLILVAVGLVKLLEPAPMRKPLLGLFLMALGGLFLLDEFGHIEFDFDYIWPLFIIFAGINIIKNHYYGGCSASKPDWFCGSKNREYSEDYLNFSAVMGGGGYRVSSHSLKGGRIMAIMGGFELNLRDADMEGSEMHIDVTAIMGGVELSVPTTWSIILQGTPLMGGFENRTAPQGEARKKLFVHASVIMGGVEFKN